ncbi:MAG: hypothetical protein GY858_08990 [Candidatus Omnitrophica bacterium]|nr:hypothetical protein [Candidatus Omnitrophota bacterium]
MSKFSKIIFLISLFLPFVVKAETKNVEPLTLAIEKVRSLHETISAPGPYDWLAQHYEPGQTFKEYYQNNPISAQDERRIIYIQPLGNFTDTERKIINTTAEFIHLFYNLEVKIIEDITLDVIPKKAKRQHPQWKMEQILSTYVLEEILIPTLPKDAAALIAFSSSDLWPGEGWNFVFGQASIEDRVGVWSIYRNGNPDKEFKLCLMRTLKTAVHEIGHMFSILHCTKYECGMCGFNHRKESDTRPLWFCPECMAKVCLATSANPIIRYQKLTTICQKYDLKNEQEFYQKSSQALE